MDNFNVLYIVSCLDRGGLELRLLAFAEQFPKNYKVHICVTSNQLDMLESFRALNTSIIIIPIERAYAELSNINRIYAYIVKHNIVIINTFDFKGLVVGCLLKIKARSKIKLIHNTVDLLHSYTLRQKAIVKFLFNCVDKSICNSQQAKNVLISIGINSKLIEVINNGVDSGKFISDPSKRNSMRLLHDISEGEIVIGTVANFRWEKNYPFLMDGFHTLLKTHDNLKLLCVGGGQEFERIKNLSIELDIFNKVIFTGSVEDVPKFLQMMDVFVLCSVKESFPNCMIQAMSVGLPVVASDIGACSDIIKDGENGLKFRVNDSVQFIENIEMLISDMARCRLIASNGNKTVMKKFSQTSMIDNYISSYNKLLATPYGIECSK